MPVTLATPVQLKTPAYTEVHLEKFMIDAECDEYARTTITARIRLYYRDQNTGLKVFSKDHFDITIPDGEAWARELMVKGDLRGIDSAKKIKEILALIVDTHTTFGSAAVK